MVGLAPLGPPYSFRTSHSTEFQIIFKAAYAAFSAPTLYPAPRPKPLDVAAGTKLHTMLAAMRL